MASSSCLPCIFIHLIIVLFITCGAHCVPLSVKMNATNLAPNKEDHPIIGGDFKQISFEIFEDFIRNTMNPGEYGSLCRNKIIEQTKYCYDENKSSMETMESFCSSNCDIINCIQGKVERFCSMQAKKVYNQHRDDFYSTLSEKRCQDELEICKESSFFGSALGIGVTISVITGFIAITCLIGGCLGYRYRYRTRRSD